MGDFDLAGRPTGTCKSCSAPIVWTLTPKNRRMPLDPEPVDDGNVVVTGRILAGRERDTPTILVLRPGEEEHLEAGRLRYVTHFSSCPNARDHRRKR